MSVLGNLTYTLLLEEVCAFSYVVVVDKNAMASKCKLTSTTLSEKSQKALAAVKGMTKTEMSDLLNNKKP